MLELQELEVILRSPLLVETEIGLGYSWGIVGPKYAGKDAVLRLLMTLSPTLSTMLDAVSGFCDLDFIGSFVSDSVLRGLATPLTIDTLLSTGVANIPSETPFTHREECCREGHNAC